MEEIDFGSSVFGSTDELDVMRSLGNQREDGLFCDVAIVVGDGRSLAHKEVLVACSEYFRRLFSNGFANGETAPVKSMDLTDDLPDLDTTEIVISSMYTLILPIRQDTVCGIFRASAFLMYERAQRACEEYMLRHISSTNCVTYWKLTKDREMFTDLHCRALSVILNRFHDCSIYDDNVLNLERVDFLDLLKRNVTKFCSPRQILTLLLKQLVRSYPDSSAVTNFKDFLQIVELTPVRNPDLTLRIVREVLEHEGLDEKAIGEVCADVNRYIIGECPKADVSVAETEDVWSLNVLYHHTPLDFEVDTIMVCTPEGQNMFGIFAYIPSSGRWADIGKVELPRAFPFSDYGVVSACESLYFISKSIYCIRVFILHLRSKTWHQFLVRDKMGHDVECFFPVVFNNEVVIIAKYQADPGDTPVESSSSKSTVALGKLHSDGRWEECLCCPRVALPNGDFRVISAFADADYVYAVLKNDVISVLLFDIKAQPVRLVSPNSQMPLRSLSSPNIHVLIHGGWIFIVDRRHTTINYAMKVDDSGRNLVVEERREIFPDVFRKFQSNRVVVAMGPSLWLLENQSGIETELSEVSIAQPDQIKRHCPPPRNDILTATSGRLKGNFIISLPLARFPMNMNMMKMNDGKTFSNLFELRQHRGHFRYRYFPTRIKNT